jgi:hypothetical protein
MTFSSFYIGEFRSKPIIEDMGGDFSPQNKGSNEKYNYGFKHCQRAHLFPSAII